MEVKGKKSRLLLVVVILIAVSIFLSVVTALLSVGSVIHQNPFMDHSIVLLYFIAFGFLIGMTFVLFLTAIVLYELEYQKRFSKRFSIAKSWAIIITYLLVFIVGFAAWILLAFNDQTFLMSYPFLLSVVLTLLTTSYFIYFLVQYHRSPLKEEIQSLEQVGQPVVKIRKPVNKHWYVVVLLTLFAVLAMYIVNIYIAYPYQQILHEYTVDEPTTQLVQFTLILNVIANSFLNLIFILLLIMIIFKNKPNSIMWILGTIVARDVIVVTFVTLPTFFHMFWLQESINSQFYISEAKIIETTLFIL
ncbi:MAG: hypothetical protein JXB08_04065 [Bacilli bacterium]|nr:hypothetical protein [Bacilli bacterium]MBN2877918.1 hypothetical protein [Bacilli bacterium]